MSSYANHRNKFALSWMFLLCLIAVTIFVVGIIFGITIQRDKSSNKEIQNRQAYSEHEEEILKARLAKLRITNNRKEGKVSLQKLFEDHETAKQLYRDAMADPLRNLPLLEISLDDLKSIKQNATRELLLELTARLREKRFVDKPIEVNLYGDNWSAVRTLFATNPGQIIETILRNQDGESLLGLMTYPELKSAQTDWIKEHSQSVYQNWKKDGFRWDQSGGMLHMYLTREEMAPSALGLNPEETHNLLEFVGRK